MQLREPSRVDKAIASAAAAAPDFVGLAGFAAVVGGVYMLFGTGWALIAFGVPTFAGYLFRETRAARLARRT